MTEHRAADAFAAFYDAHVRDVYSYARARVGADDAEDVTSEVFHVAAVAFQQGRDGEVNIAWLIGVARNKVIDRWRMAQRRKAKAHLIRNREEVSVPPDWYDDVRRDAVLATMDELSDRHRSLLILHHLDGMPIREIADAFDQSERAVESALARARRAFKAEYERRRP